MWNVTFVDILILIDVFIIGWEILILEHVVNFIVVGMVLSSIIVIHVRNIERVLSMNKSGNNNYLIFSLPSLHQDILLHV
jgi:hypothetical protein